MNRKISTVAALLLLVSCLVLKADEFARMCVDRTVIEHVYYEHRLGSKPPFEQTVPPSLIEQLVREDLHKESVLKHAYGLEITPALLDTEVQRINTATRAPDMLAEIKKALDNDPVRFAIRFAKPVLVERLLRDRFDNDDALHAPRRHEMEWLRESLLDAKRAGDGIDQLLPLVHGGHSMDVNEVTWQLGARPEADESWKHAGPDAQISWALQREERIVGRAYFQDLPQQLQRVLSVQLTKAGDVSAVIETPGGFLLYLLKQRTAATLTVAVAAVPKQSYDDWLVAQKE